MNETLLKKLRATELPKRLGKLENDWEATALSEFDQSGVKFVCSSDVFETQYYKAVRELMMCIKPMDNQTGGKDLILQEGGVYFGCWIESTGTINAELLSRFIPSVSQATFSTFADNQFVDGLFPYKVTAEGPAFFQIQIVTPLARCVWNQYALNGQDKAFLTKMYKAMSHYDQWLATYRDTLGTGGVEAFCSHDTGHDLSSRFWHVPDSPHENDPRKFKADNPVLPFVAPDLTANVICQRFYLARIAEELGEDGAPWREKAEQSLAALFEHCYDEDDGFFYDLDRNGQHVKVQSDVLLRVLACEVGDDAFFAAALKRYLLNTGKFFSRYPFTSIALDDPRFDHKFDHNSWCGPTNLLSLIRTAHAFEVHHRYVELTWVLYPILFSLFHMKEFAQTINPFTGEAGFTSVYSPTILCLLDFVERLSGILPTPEGQLWFTGLVPYQVEQKQVDYDTAYSRDVDGKTFELVNTKDESVAYMDGELLFRAPKGIRVVSDRQGKITAIIGMSVSDVEGMLITADGEWQVHVKANQQFDLVDGEWVSVRDTGIVPPSF